MSCDEALPLLYDLADGDIGRDEAIAVARHLAACPACAAKLSAIEGAERLYAERTAVAAPPELAARITRAVRLARPGPERKGHDLWLAAGAAAALAAAVALVQRAAGLPDAAARLGAAAVAWLTGLSSSVAAAWSALTAWLAAPAVLGGGVALLAALVALQIGGSIALLFARRREGPRP